MGVEAFCFHFCYIIIEFNKPFGRFVPNQFIRYFLEARLLMAVNFVVSLQSSAMTWLHVSAFLFGIIISSSPDVIRTSAPAVRVLMTGVPKYIASRITMPYIS